MWLHGLLVNVFDSDDFLCGCRFSFIYLSKRSLPEKFAFGIIIVNALLANGLTDVCDPVIKLFLSFHIEDSLKKLAQFKLDSEINFPIKVFIEF
jgi:hypothetical protein